jgi:hypothetical protein
MANGSGDRSSLPVAGIAGIVLAAVVVLASHEAPYLATRPPESAKFPDLSIAVQHVDARLWQDPFSAVESFEHREVARRMFDADAEKFSPSAPSRRADSARSREAPFVTVRFGVTPEAFRGLMEVSGAVAPRASQARALPVLMSGSHFVGAEEARRRTRYAVLAALDELGYAPVDGDHIGYVVVPSADASRGSPPVRIPFEAYQASHPGQNLPVNVIVLWVDESALAPTRQGSTWLDSLADALRVLGVCPAAPTRCNVPVIGPSSSDRYEALARLLDPSQTVALPWLVSPFVTSNLLEDPDIRGKLEKSGLTVFATIVPDRIVIDALLRELSLRKVPLCDSSKYVLLVGEWDTEYGRRAKETFTREFGAQECTGVKAQSDGERARVLSYSFVRGLDGVAIGTPDKEPHGVEQSPSSSSAGNAGSAQIEWPESADQRDYLRRIGQQLSQLRLARRVTAVGILASDTHDKILLLQGLRGIFPRAVFFTTDVDARYMHPLVRPWTRNLIIAGAYGLVLGEELQRRTPPFRDGYQTSTFLATSAALQLPAAINGRADWRFLGQQPVQLYEVGRTRLVPLLPDTGESTAHPPCDFAVLDGCREGLQPRYSMPRRGLRIRVALVLLWFISAAFMFAWAWRNPVGGVTRSRGAGPVLSYVFLIGLAGSLAYFALLLWQVAHPQARAYPPEPLLFSEGISSWPIALLWCFGLALTLMFLARIARTLRPRLDATRQQFLGAWTDPEGEGARTGDGYWEWLKTALCVPQPTPTLGSSARTQFADVWRRYQRHAHGWRRAARIAVLWVILFVFPFLLVRGTELAPPPVIRGPFQSVLWQLDIAHFLMLTILMAAVADAAILCTLFVVDLGRRRNEYPELVLQSTCRRLGLPESLKPYLDEYIDCQVIGERTAAVAEYLYYPFIVMAVLAIAMTSLFDDWVFSLARVGLYAFYVGVLLLLWLGLHSAATRARTVALAEMDVMWIGLQRDQNHDQETAETMRRQFPLLMEQVRNLRIGAYGPLLAQPIFRALLWPLGTVSSTQLVQYLFLR